MQDANGSTIDVGSTVMLAGKVIRATSDRIASGESVTTNDSIVVEVAVGDQKRQYSFEAKAVVVATEASA